MTNENKIKVMIVDDEELARTRIRQLIEKDSEIEIVAECGNGANAVAALKRLKADILFLDIQMPDMNGFGVLRKVESQELPLIIFVTAYDEFALKAFEFHACDYLLKPFKKKRFEEALMHAKREIQNKDQKEWIRRTCALLETISSNSQYLDRFTIKDRGRVFFVKTRDVDWIEAQDNYVRIHSGKDDYLIRQQIGHLQKELDPKYFIRIHRGAIVNIERIHELQQWFKRDYRVVLSNGVVLPLGRSYREKLRNALRSEF